jgi:hypothetical protein
MKQVPNKLRVSYYAQIPCKPFTVEVANEKEALLIVNTLTNQHLFLFEQKIIPDYCDVINVQMYDNDDDDGDGWVNYYNEEEEMNWDELVEHYFNQQEPDVDNVIDNYDPTDNELYGNTIE